MSRGVTDRIAEDLPRLRMVQALLGAVVAKAAGYDGPVLGSQQDDDGNRAELAWWPAKEDPEVTKVHLAERRPTK